MSAGLAPRVSRRAAERIHHRKRRYAASGDTPLAETRVETGGDTAGDTGGDAGEGDISAGTSALPVTICQRGGHRKSPPPDAPRPVTGGGPCKPIVRSPVVRGGPPVVHEGPPVIRGGPTVIHDE